MENGVDPQDRGVGTRREDHDSEDDIFDLLLSLAGRKLRILLWTLAGGVLALVLAYIVPPIYTATAIILPPQQQSSAAASALLGQLGNLAGLAGQSLNIKNPSDVYVGILSSRTTADKLIAEYKLKDIYGLKTLEDTRRRLARMTRFNTAKYSLIQISVKDPDPARAAGLANAYLAQLQDQSSRLAVTEASQRRLFFERQLGLEKNHLAEAEAAFRNMQEQKGILQVSSQVEAVIRSMAQIKSEITAREVNLQRLKAGATGQNPEVYRQEIELGALKAQLKKMETSSATKSPGDPLLPTSMVPEAGMEYARRLRELKYRETLFELLAKQYEAARIDEAKEAPVIQIIDYAVPPDKRTSPSRSIYVAIGILLGGMAGLVSALFDHAAENSKKAEKISALKRSLWISRRS